MNNFVRRLQRRSSEDPFLGFAVSIGILTTLIALALYAYLGFFSRYASDDYCLSSFFLQNDFIHAMIQRYYDSSSRYTNILFIGLSDKLLGWYNVAILPALMLSLFVFGMYLFLKEIFAVIRLGWGRGMIFLLSLLIVYFSIIQAPDLYEILYWRAGMTSHFAPVVFMPIWGAFLLRQIRNVQKRASALWIPFACFIILFVVGGFSEPPTALMITILVLASAAVWWGGDPRNRRSILILLSWSLLGAVTALLTMALAPANSLRMQSPPPALLELISRIIDYPSFFIVDTLRTLPTPTWISFTLPALLFYAKYSDPFQDLSQKTRKRLILLIIVVMVLAYLFIAASFAPSAYGQSYPVPRARFAARVIMTVALMTEGALLGVLASQLRTKSFSPILIRNVGILVFAILALYPLRTAWRTFGEVPVYQERAAVWDAREAEILAMKAQGQTDLAVRFLSEAPIQDLGDHKEYRLNRCAATLYGVNTIVAVPMDDQ
jgi:hypothetical protein